MSRGDWRRAQVNQAIEEVSRAIADEKEYVRFGISPFGIPAPAKPEQISGLDQYEKLYADTQLWMDKGWVDYLAPQLYWPTTREPQAYQVLLDWWNVHAKDGRYIFPGINLAALGTKPEWDLAEYHRQFSSAGPGFIVWNITPLLENRQDVLSELFAGPEVLTPPIARQAHRQVEPPEVERDGAVVVLEHRDSVPLRAFTFYRWENGRWHLEKIVRGSRIELASGHWAVASVCRDGAESLARVIQ